MQQRRGVPSRKHKTGTTVLVLTSHLSGASSKSIDLTDQASFLSTDTVITTKNLSFSLNEIVNACLWLWIFCTTVSTKVAESCELVVVRHFLVGAAAAA